MAANRPPARQPSGPLAGPFYTSHQTPQALEHEFRELWAVVHRIAEQVSNPPEVPTPEPEPEPTGGLRMWSKVVYHQHEGSPEFYELQIPVVTFPAPSTYVMLDARCVTVLSLTTASEYMPTWELLGTNDRRATYRGRSEDPWPTLDPARFSYATKMGPGPPDLVGPGDLAAAHNWLHLVGFHSPRQINTGAPGEYEDAPGNVSIGPDLYQPQNAVNGDTVYLKIRSHQTVFPCWLALFYGFYFSLGEHVGWTRDGNCPEW